LKTQSLALVAVLIVAVVAGGAYFSGAFGPSKSQSQSSSQTVDVTIIGGVGVGTVDTFVPDNFTVTKGQNVTLVVQNTDDNTHGVEIPQFGVNSGLILPGDTVRLSFLANQTGVFRYQEPPGDCKGGFGGVCNSVQHMWGFITIVGP
jgi:heme/copper-type cytochrome/quinol oxidase subunit 2